MAAAYPRESYPLPGQNYESLPLETEGASGLNKTETSDEERMSVLRNKFHMIDVCACLFLSSMRKAHMTRRKSGFNKAGGWGGRQHDRCSCQDDSCTSAFFSRLQPFFSCTVNLRLSWDFSPLRDLLFLAMFA